MAKTLFYDSITGQSFIGDEERIKEAIEELNKELLDRSRLNMSDIYAEINKDLPEHMQIGRNPICSELCLDFDYKQLEENPNYKPIDMNHTLYHNDVLTIKLNYDMNSIKLKDV